MFIIAIVFYCRKITILKAPGMDVDSYLLSLTLHAVYARVIATLAIPKNKSHLEAASLDNLILKDLINAHAKPLDLML